MSFVYSRIPSSYCTGNRDKGIARQSPAGSAESDVVLESICKPHFLAKASCFKNMFDSKPKHTYFLTQATAVD